MMGGLHFIHPGWMAGALAAAVPIALHLLFRPRPRLVDLGTLRFLQIVVQDHARWRRVRRLVLLALRVAVALLLAVLFARPYRVGSRALGGEREVLLLIDQSASMSARSSFRRASDAALAVLKSLPEQTVARVAYCDDSGVFVAPEPKIEQSRPPGFAATNHVQALGWARDLIAQSRRRERSVYYFSDLQRAGPERPLPEGWPSGVPLEVVAVGRPLTSNLAVVDAAVPRTEVRPGAPFVVAAVVLNAGPFPARDVPVRLRLSGGIARDQTVSVASGDRAAVRFTLEGLRPGLYEGSVEVVAHDDFPADDRRWLVFETRPFDRVLLVDGDPGASVFGAETYYLETALRLRPPGAGPSATSYEPVVHAWTEGVPLPKLQDCRVVVLANTGPLTAGDVSALREFVTAGGGLLCFAGGHTTPAATERLRAARVFPAEFLGVAEPGSFRFATWEQAHPLLKPFADPQNGDLRRLEFRRIVRLKPGPGARVLAATTEGDPLLIEEGLGTGKVLICAFAADRDWGDWPVNRLYLPFVHQVLGDLTDRLPETRRIQTAATGPGREHPPGVERTKAGLVAHNLDPQESASARFTPDEFRRAYRLPQTVSSVKLPTAAVPPLPGTQRPDEWWRAVVWGLFAVLVLETFVANRTPA